MRESTGNIWDQPADIVVITTNGFVKRDGTLVMGRGIAREAAQRFPDLPALAGRHVSVVGNVVKLFEEFGILTMPVKHVWWEEADLDLIEQSAWGIRGAVDAYEYTIDREPTVVMPRPGCGNGKLLWSDVKPVIEPILDDRFTVYTWR